MPRSKLLALASLVLFGCGPSDPRALDASAREDVGASDAAVADAPRVGDAAPAADARTDAGCLERPGELVGERSVATGRFPALAWEGAEGSVSLVAFHRPCTPPGSLIVLRDLAAWSAPALVHVGHTAELARMDDVVVIDLWAADATGMPMTRGGLAAIAARYDEAPDAIVADPDETLAPLGPAGILLPLVAVLDARTLEAVSILMDPREGELEHAVRAARARLVGADEPDPLEPSLVDGRFTRDRWELIQAMAAPFVPPPSPSNAVADDPRAAALGASLFDDAQLSPHGIACRSCHDPDRGFADGLALGVGVAEGTRNTPTVIGIAGSAWPFWDGRVDSVWAQATGPIENPLEMASSRLLVAHRVAGAHRAEYEAIFGALPPLEDADRFPSEGRPGDASWEAMAPADREAVTRVFANVAKAIEAHERTIGWAPGRLEAYAAGDLDALDPEERDGLANFLSLGCVQCHAGPRLANDAFFALGMPGKGEGDDRDEGRFAAFTALAEGEFRMTGPFGDAPGLVDPLAGLVAFPPSTRGAFRTQTLRAIAHTAPYGHAGTFETLTDVVRHYAQIRWPHPADPRVAGSRDLHLISFEESRIPSLVAFLETL